MKFRILSISSIQSVILPSSYRTKVEADHDCGRMKQCPGAVAPDDAIFIAIEDLASEHISDTTNRSPKEHTKETRP